MKKFKKVLAAVLAMTMVLGMSVTSMAAPDEKIGNSDDTGTITVNGINSDEATPEVTAYQIIKANYDANGAFIGYVPVYPDVTPSINLAGTATDSNAIGSVVTISEEELSALANHIAKEGPADKTTHEMTVEKSTGKATATVGIGSYLVMIKGSDTNMYSPVVVSLYYVNAGGAGNGVDGGNLTIANTDAWVKVTNTPQVHKEIVASPSDATSSTPIKHNSVNIGDDVNFKLPVGPIPNYTGTKPVFKIVDTLSAGLTYNNDLKVYKADNTELAESYYKLTVNGQVITVDFADGYNYTLNEFANQSLEIRYSAKLNESAGINQEGNDNTVVLNYTKDSTIDGEDATSSDVTHTYTFDLDGAVEGSVTTNILRKTGVEVATNSSPLKDAEFTLYKDEATTVKYTNTTNTTGIITSDENGQLKIRGLAAGTYYLKETKAPAGYSLNTTVFTIEITATYKDDNTLDTWSIKVNDKTVNDGKGTINTFQVNNGTATVTNAEGKVDSVEIPNTKLSSLPSTGGIGTTIFTLGGCAIMIIAAGLYFASRRKKTEK